MLVEGQLLVIPVLLFYAIFFAPIPMAAFNFLKLMKKEKRRHWFYISA